MLLEVLILPFFAAALAYGQFTSGVDLVEVYATVFDRNGNPVGTLTQADFQVSDDGAPQAIATFSAGEVPLALAIGIDRSFSMTAGQPNRLAMAKRTAATLLNDLRQGDRVAVVAIGSEIQIVAPLSPDRAAARRAVDELDAWGTTPLYDATVRAIDAIQPAAGRRALVLLSDGVDRDSAMSASELVDAARRRDVLVYPIAIAAARPPVLAELAAATGGRSFAAHSATDLDAAVGAIARELRMQYLIGYTLPRHGAPAGRGPRWHAIDVTVRQPGLRVRARDGYFAP